MGLRVGGHLRLKAGIERSIFSLAACVSTFSASYLAVHTYSTRGEKCPEPALMVVPPRCCTQQAPPMSPRSRSLEGRTRTMTCRPQQQTFFSHCSLFRDLGCAIQLKLFAVRHHLP